MEVLEGGEDLEDVGQRLVDREGVVAARLAHPLLEQRLEGGPADVLHDDVAGALVHDEVVDLDDPGVLDLGEEALLGNGGRQGVRVAGVEQALEDHPAVGDVAVAGEIDPAQTTVGEAAGDVVLPSHEIPGLELGVEGEGLATLGAETGRAAGAITLAAPDLGAAVGAEPLVLGDHGILHHRRRRIDRRHRRDDGQASAQTGRAHPLARRPDSTGGLGAGLAGPGRADRRRGQPVTRHRTGRAHRGRVGGRLGRVAVGGRPADVAVAVEDVSLAARLGARSAVGDGRGDLSLGPGRGRDRLFLGSKGRSCRSRARRFWAGYPGAGCPGAGRPWRAAHVAVTIEDRAGAAGLLALRRGGHRGDAPFRPEDVSVVRRDIA